MRGKRKSESDYKITNIINYVRKSRRDEEMEKRTGEDTLAEQKRLMASLLDDMGIPYEQRFEVGSGDSIEHRPVFQAVLEDLRKNKYDAIAVKEISRLGRGRYEDMGLIFDLLQEKRVYIITPYRTYDPNNPNDARQIRFELFFAREEFEQIRERMVGARYNYAMQGKWMTGSVPFGYEFNKSTQRLQIVEDQAKTVRLIFDLYVNGLNGKRVAFRAISTYLFSLGIKSPRGGDRWEVTTIKRLLINPVYIGHVRFSQTEIRKGKVLKRPEDERIYVENAHDPIIDQEIFYKAQERVNNPKGIRPKVKAGISELTGVLTCGECGKKITINRSKRKHTKKDGEVSIYHDVFLRCANGCLTTRYEPVERNVVDLLVHLKNADADVLTSALRSYVDRKSIADPSNERQVADLLSQLGDKKRELNKRREFIFDRYEKGIYDDDTFLERRNALEEELKEVLTVETDLLEGNDQASSSKNIDFDLDKVREKFSSFIQTYNDASTEDRNKLLHSIFHSIKLTILEKGNNQRFAKIKLTPRLKLEIVK
jgi:site-specific DNA recombinase